VTDSEDNQAFKVEQRGIEHVPEDDRPTRPFNLSWVWAAAVFNITYVVGGALAIALGLSLPQAIVVIILGNLSWILVGVYSLQGPRAGTTTWAINRAPFGPNGARGMSSLNWLTVIGYEVVATVTSSLAVLALLGKAGVHTGKGLQILVAVLVGIVQTILPIFGHATILKVLRLLVIPFVILFALLAILIGTTSHHAAVQQHGSWQSFLLVLAIVISFTGLGWSNMANDYSRYIPVNAAPRKIVLSASLGGGITSTLLMLLGAFTATVVPVATDPISGLTTAFPAWFVVPYLIAIVIQLMGANTLNLYSSGLTLQVIGLRVKRYYAMLLDTVLAIALTIAVILSKGFYKDLSDFLLFGIVWLAPWAGVFGADWLLRRRVYDIEGLLDVTPRSVYWGRGGVNVRGVVAQLLGMGAAALCLNAEPVFQGYVSKWSGGADFSVFAGFAVGALVYILLSSGMARATTARREVQPSGSVAPAPRVP
jgi:nucleobase:cation symporter-1, NCS1 family